MQLGSVSLLLDHGVPLNSINPLDHAMSMHKSNKRSDDMLRLLVERGANLELRNASGCTVLHKAAKLGNVSAVRTLLELGASIHTSDINGQTPLEAARRSMQSCLTKKRFDPEPRPSYQAVIAALVSAGAVMDA